MFTLSSATLQSLPRLFSRLKLSIVSRYPSSFPCSSQAMPVMKKPAAWIKASNERRRAREHAVKAMNQVARGIGIQQIQVKAP